MLVAMAGNPPAKRREHVEMTDRALFAKADIERDDIDTCGMHVGQLPENFRLTAAQRHAGMIVPDETADDTVEIGRASCRERVCKYVSISVVAVPVQNTTLNYTRMSEVRLHIHT